LDQAEIGIIGGSGLYSMPGLTDTREVFLQTPFGDPSDAYILGTLEGRRVAFLSRHGRGHRIPPHQLNFRANIYGMKQLAVERILSVSAVGSLQDKHPPGAFLIPSQFVDRTKARISTFFAEGIVAHISFADPVCPEVAGELDRACAQAGVAHQSSGTYLCIEGPQFSTKAESNLYRSWNMDVIGMTALPEAKLAREAEICYAALAMVTDYDCWHPSHESVTVDQIVAVLNRNAHNACDVVRYAVAGLPKAHGCSCGSALQYAIMTDAAKVPSETRQRLHLLVDKYFAPQGAARAAEGEAGA